MTTSAPCKHDWQPLGPCAHPLELGKLGYAFRCATCGEREHRLTQSTWVPEPAFEWMMIPAMTDEEQARLIEEERHACPVTGGQG